MAPPQDCIIHPLVLLNCVDHYNRVARDTSKRVVGVLLGKRYKGTVDCFNSFAVPFEEDRKDPDVWYLDHNYLEDMERMFRKVNTNEKIVGFYSTGPQLRKNDLQIETLFRKYVPNPVFIVIDVRPDFEGVPFKAYTTHEEVVEGRETVLEFKHVPIEMGADGPEDIGVEHLLRDINDPSASSLANRIKHKMSGLKVLKGKLEEMQTYLKAVLAGTMPKNNQILKKIQDIFNLIPNLTNTELAQAFLSKSNDTHLIIYLSSLVRSVISLHDLVNNKIKYKDIDEIDGESKKKKEETKEETKDDTKKKSSPKKS
jgi:26S proteasome regulatory subunit N8|eukprot:g6815.t1